MQVLISVSRLCYAAYFVAGSDIGKFTLKAIDDIRTLNKSVHFRPSCNFLNINELAYLWEKKIGRILPRVTVTEDDLLAAAEGIHILHNTCYLQQKTTISKYIKSNIVNSC